MDEAKLRESAVAELRVDHTTSDGVWTITSRDRLADQAIAEALPTERCDGSPESCGLVRTVLADEVAIRIKDAGSVLGGRELLDGAGEQWRSCSPSDLNPPLALSTWSRLHGGCAFGSARSHGMADG
ncbi:hypothetical protein TNCT6_56900 [Streptomyces sp. 6-11-2]|nr:hypothetical protein TNCT6_56900 [Streptomyces sp. 6-11-2]